MRTTLAEALYIINHLRKGETFDDYEKRMKRLRRLCNERDDLQDAIKVISEYSGTVFCDEEKLEKKKKRLEKVYALIEELKD